MRIAMAFIGTIIGFFIGEFTMEYVFTTLFGLQPVDAEGTKYEFYLIFMTFNGAIFGSAMGGLFGFLLGHKFR